MEDTMPLPLSPRKPPVFDEVFRSQLRELLIWRRDVRRFRSDAVDQALVVELITLASHAPSVGNSQPWRFVIVESTEIKAIVRTSFETANRHALDGYAGQQREAYAKLKLAGLDVAPVQMAVFSDEGTTDGAKLGRETMPETLAYSVVGAIQLLWLAARAHGLGVGWVSILEPTVVKAALTVPESWRLVAYLCLGWPQEEHLDPELERVAWQSRLDSSRFIFKR